ncbi:hypothetical protein CK203_023075 [Vitis vinifera]|uniref:Uncharacterized protein n=1 Tax=Vitis vinifera TaxID=29760 RepID=A0A438J442_VITVI|nr:hypothetical protein CK203_023075 [Vitis vinifera]
MEKPPTPSAIPSSQPPPRTQKRKLPTPKELIAHYESQGMEPQEASLKVIDDLQTALFRVISSGRGKKDRFTMDASRKLDTANARLAILEMKLDSKPGYPQTLALGVASAGIASALPHVFGAFSQIWSSVRSASK